MDARTFFRWLLAVFFVAAGANHFWLTEFYTHMMPPWLPRPTMLVYISGVAEILGGLGTLIPAARRAAGWGLIALLVAVFPANIHMALEHLSPPGMNLPVWLLWARLPFQVVLLAGVYWTSAGQLRIDTLD